MRRRSFLALACGAAAWAPPLHAQRAKPVVGFLSTRSPEEAAGHTGGFLDGLKQAGFVAPDTLTLGYRWARGNYLALPALAAELVAAGPNVLAAGGDPAALAAKAATSTLPIAFLIGDDPVRIGLAASLNRPGGNSTGVSLVTSALGAKRLEILARLAPGAAKIALLVNPTNPNASLHTGEVTDAAASLGRQVAVFPASAATPLEQIVAALKEQGAGALIVQNDPFFDTQRDRLVALTARHGLPAIYHIREFPLSGGLASYGPNLVAAYRELGLQAARLLQGADPKTLPVVRPNTFEMAINLRTAKALGLAVPESLLIAADEIIE